MCDTSFLIHLATKRIKNISTIDTEIGNIEFVIPTVVRNELLKLEKNEKKKKDVLITLHHIQNFKTKNIGGYVADESLLDYVSKNKGIVATMDKELKKKIKQAGGSIISLNKDKIVLEPSKI